jgi:hypothetical protein
MLKGSNDGDDKKEKEVLVPLPLIVPPQFTRVLAIFFICHTLGLLAYILPQVRVLQSNHH